MVNMNRTDAKSRLPRKATQQMKQNNRIDSAREPDRDALAAQVVRAQESARRGLSARRLP